MNHFVCVCCSCTIDNRAGVKAAVLLAPVGSDAGALWEIAHGWRLHIDDLHTENGETVNVNTKCPLARTHAHYSA